MNEPALVGLLSNAALLMALVLLFDLDDLQRRASGTRVRVITGAIIGLLGLGVQMAPWEFAPGIYLDTRSVLLSLSGLHFGALPAGIALVVTGAFRVFRGGPGVTAGILQITSSAAIGVAWRHLRPRFANRLPTIELFLFGFLVHVPTLIFLTHTSSPVGDIANEAAIACLVGYPVITVLVGSLFNARRARRASEAFIERRRAYDQAVAAISARFVATGDLDAAINASLAQIGHVSRADRVHVFMLRTDGVTIDGTHEWCAEGVAALLPDMRGVSVDRIAWWSSHFVKGEAVQVEDTAGLSGEAPSTKAFLDSMGIVSIIALPLLVGSRCTGFVGLHKLSRADPGGPDDLALVRVVVRLLGDAIGRAQADEQLAFQAVLLDQVQNFVLAADLERKVTFVNRALCQWLGVLPGELLGRRADDVPRLPLPKRSLDEIAERVLGERQWRSEVAGTAPDGSEILLESRAQLVHNHGGEPTGFLVIATDITDRVRAEQSVRDSEARYRSLFNSSPVTLWEEDFTRVKAYLDELAATGVTDLRTHLEENPDTVARCIGLVEVLDVNEAALRLYGAESKEELLASLERIFSDGSHHLFREELCAFWEGKTAFESENVGVTLAGRHINNVVSIRIAPGQESTWGRVLVSVTDITDRTRAERSLRESETRYRSLFDNSPISLWEEDFTHVKAYLDGLRASGIADMRAHLESNPATVAHCLSLVEVINVNEASVRLYEAKSKDELLQSLDRVFTERAHEIFLQQLCAFCEGQMAFESENVGVKLSGELLDSVLGISIAPGYEETWGRVLVSVTDISERVGAERALRDKQRQLEQALAELETMQEQLVHQERMAAVGQLSAGIAHDFNNILAAITLYTQLSLRNKQLSPEIARRFEVINDQANLAADLVQQILDFGRQSIIERQPVDVAELLRKSATLLEHTLPESVAITLDVAPGRHLVSADPARIQQAVLNLALNARDAMPDGGQLGFSLTRADDTPITCISCGPVASGSWSCIEVRDTGVGIAPAVLPHIFEPFFTTRAPLGHGLGLAQVYGIVRQHDGHIEVETKVGAGTTFRLFWPALAFPTAEAETEPRAVRIPEGAGHTVLVVEDNTALRDGLVDLLSMWGFATLSSAGGAEALAICEQLSTPPSLVLTDWIMPGIDGLKLAQELEDRGVHTKVLVLSGHPRTSTTGLLASQESSEVSANVVGWLAKPPDTAQLAAALVDALG